MTNITTWHTLISRELINQKERWKDVVGVTLTRKEMHRAFDADYGEENGAPFTLWTDKRVYFPVCCDGAEWVASAPRNPSPEKMGHVGG